MASQITPLITLSLPCGMVKIYRCAYKFEGSEGTVKIKSLIHKPTLNNIINLIYVSYLHFIEQHINIYVNYYNLIFIILN